MEWGGEGEKTFFAVIIKTLVPVLKRAKQRTFRGDRDEERERESSCPSRVWEDAKLRLNVLKLRDFCSAQMYHMKPGLPCTPTHTWLNVKGRCVFVLFVFFKTLLFTYKNADRHWCISNCSCCSTGDTRRLCTFRTCCLNRFTQFVAYVMCVTTIIAENGPSETQT